MVGEVVEEMVERVWEKIRKVEESRKWEEMREVEEMTG